MKLQRLLGKRFGWGWEAGLAPFPRKHDPFYRFRKECGFYKETQTLSIVRNQKVVKVCFGVNLVNKKAIEHLLKPFTDAEIPQTWVPRRWVDAFTFPLLPVLMEGGKVELARWGLIPSWAKDDRVLELRRMTLNAKSETIFTLPSFRNSASSQRCLIPVNGFFEYQHLNSAGVPDPTGKRTNRFF